MICAWDDKMRIGDKVEINYKGNIYDGVIEFIGKDIFKVMGDFKDCIGIYLYKE